jgi:hypothetical protein
VAHGWLGEPEESACVAHAGVVRALRVGSAKQALVRVTTRLGWIEQRCIVAAPGLAPDMNPGFDIVEGGWLADDYR